MRDNKVFILLSWNVDRKYNIAYMEYLISSLYEKKEVILTLFQVSSPREKRSRGEDPLDFPFSTVIIV